MNKAVPMAKKAYAYLAINPARHLRTELDKGAGAPLSLQAVARGYKHQPEADLHRIKVNELHDKRAADGAATLWMIKNTAQRFAEWLDIEERDGQTWVSFKPGFGPDDLRFKGEPVHPNYSVSKQFKDPFDPFTGIFRKNIREDIGDISKLVESMRAHGWNKHLPAIVDRRGTVIVGSRRMAAAKEAGVEPVTVTLDVEIDDAGDAERLRLAIVSNVGSKPFTKPDRRRIAAYLYQSEEEDWDVQAIANALKVTPRTIYRDLEAGGLTDVKPPEAQNRGGRPRKGAPVDPHEGVLAPHFDDYMAGKPINKIADEVGINYNTVKHSFRRMKAVDIGRQRALEEAAQAVPGRRICTCCNGTGFAADDEGGSQ